MSPREYRRDLPTLERAFDFTIEEREVPTGIEPGYFLSGYASVFDAPAEIHEQGRSFTETVRRGAFRRTLSTNAPPVVLWEHGHGFIGNLPIARLLAAREDERGLWIEAEVFKNVQVEAIREAIDARAVNTMSFKFQVLKDTWTRDKTQRDIHEVRLFEVSAVTFAAYPQTTLAVRSDKEGTTVRATTRAERQRRVRQIRADQIRRSYRKTTKAERLRRVAELRADSTGGIVIRRGMSRAERLALVEHYRRQYRALSPEEVSHLQIRRARDQISAVGRHVQRGGGVPAGWRQGTVEYGRMFDPNPAHRDRR